MSINNSEHNFSLTNEVTKPCAMLFAAGLGTRLKPFTDKYPKALAMVNGKTLLQRNIEYLNSFGITNIVVNVHHFAEQIITILKMNNGFGASVVISNEEDEILETGGGLKKAIPLFGNANNLFVMNVDILTNLDLNKMLQYHIQQHAAATLAVTNRTTSRNLVFDNENNLMGWYNSATNELRGIDNFNEQMYNKFAFSGIHIITKKLLLQINQTGKFSMIDLYLNLMNTNKIKAYDHSNDIFIDVGKPESIDKAERMFF